MVDRARPELDGERHGAALRELVAVQAQREAGNPARRQVAARLPRVERAALEERIGGVRDPRRVRQHLRQGVVDVRIRVVELRRDRVGAEPGRAPARSSNRAQRGELRVAVEAVARLALPRRRAVVEHPRRVPFDTCAQGALVERTRCPHRREDPAAARVQLFVRRPRCTARELVDAVAAPPRMRVAVDEARDRAQAAAVELVDVARERPEVAHATKGLDLAAAAEDVRVLVHEYVAEVATANGRRRARRRRGELREVADEQPRLVGHASRADGRSSSCSRAAASASS